MVGDWNGWSLSSTTYRFQPVYDQPGVYSLYINSPIDYKSDYSVGFVINPSGNADWNKVVRPTTTSADYVVNQADVAETPAYYTGGNAQWQLVANKSPRDNTNNGGSYLMTLDVTDPDNPQWSIKSTPDVRVLYFLSSDNSYIFDGD